MIFLNDFKLLCEHASSLFDLLVKYVVVEVYHAYFKIWSLNAVFSDDSLFKTSNWHWLEKGVITGCPISVILSVPLFWHKYACDICRDQCRSRLNMSSVCQPLISAFMDDTAVSTQHIPSSRCILKVEENKSGQDRTMRSFIGRPVEGKSDLIPNLGCLRCILSTTQICLAKSTPAGSPGKEWVWCLKHPKHSVILGNITEDVSRFHQVNLCNRQEIVSEKNIYKIFVSSHWELYVPWTVCWQK